MASLRVVQSSRWRLIYFAVRPGSRPDDYDPIWLIQLIIIWPQRVDADASIRILSIHTPSSSINLIAFAIHISSRHNDHRPILISNQHHSICFGFLSFQFAFHFDHLHMFFEEHCCHHTFSSIAASIQPNPRKKHLGLHTPLGHFTSSHSGWVVKVKNYTIVTPWYWSHLPGWHNFQVVKIAWMSQRGMQLFLPTERLINCCFCATSWCK